MTSPFYLDEKVRSCSLMQENTTGGLKQQHLRQLLPILGVVGGAQTPLGIAVTHAAFKKLRARGLDRTPELDNSRR
jgi:hypothetical protein